ncbi:MAG TPA: hypothetical protein VGM45_08820 [Gaiellaceae bacterium]|jgi:hypothetical protein
MDHFWSASLAEWLTGVGTLGLAALALVGIVRDRAERRELRGDVQRERDRADLIERRTLEAERTRSDRAQAEQIVAWADEAESGDHGFVFEPGAHSVSGIAPSAFVLNDSSLPITNVNIAWCVAEGSAVLETRNLAVIPPRTLKVRERPHSLRQQDIRLPVEIDFADSRGVHWKRLRDGRLVRLDPLN